MGGASIQLDGISRHYRGPAGLVRALDNVSFEVQAGTSVAITGPSGCGKSTLLSLIGGLDIPSAGQVRIGGHSISSLSERRRARVRRREFGFVFQSHNLFPFLTAIENVAQQQALSLGRTHRGIPNLRMQRCTELLSTVGLAAHTHKLPDQLSGGQRQRIAVARALAHAPRVFLADEPTGSLDPDNAMALVDLLVAVHRTTDYTLVVVTHDPAVAARLDRTITLHEGRLTRDSAVVLSGREV